MCNNAGLRRKQAEQLKGLHSSEKWSPQPEPRIVTKAPMGRPEQIRVVVGAWETSRLAT